MSNPSYLMPPTLKLEVRFRALQKALLPPWLGSTLHGALGQAMRHLTCSPECAERHGDGVEVCPYARLFEGGAGPVRPDETSLTDSRGIRPQALVLHPPSPIGNEEDTSVAPGAFLEIGLVLIGPALVDLGYVLAGLERLGRHGIGKGRGKWALEEVKANETLVFSRGRVIAAPQPDSPISLSSWRSDDGAGGCDHRRAELGEELQLRVSTKTPLRLYRKKALLSEPSLVEIVSAALRRILALDHWYGEGRLNLDEEELIRIAEGCQVEGAEWAPFRVTRYSSRQKKRHPMEGVEGSIAVRGALAPLLPILKAGSRFGIGKATSFGFGLVDIVVEGCH